MSRVKNIDSLPKVHYPERDGKRMADNTEQFDWIVTVKQGLELEFANDPNVFIAGDLLWYPVEGDNKTRVAPDTMVAFGRPKGPRGSYRQWDEGNIAPQVVFEILSPGNRPKEMQEKLEFYERFGVEEYYLINPTGKKKYLKGWRRVGNKLIDIVPMNNWISPRLKIRFEFQNNETKLYHADGSPFESYVEIDQKRRLAQEQIKKALEEKEKTNLLLIQEQKYTEELEQEKQKALEKAEKLLAKLRDLGIDPNDI